MLLEQEEVTMVLKQQQSGRSPVDAKDVIEAVKGILVLFYLSKTLLLL